MEGHLFDDVAGPGLRGTHVKYSKSQWEGHESKAKKMQGATKQKKILLIHALMPCKMGI